LVSRAALTDTRRASCRFVIWRIIGVANSLKKFSGSWAKRLEKKAIQLRFNSPRKEIPREERPKPRGEIQGDIYTPPRTPPGSGVFSELTLILRDLARCEPGISKLEARNVFSHNSDSGRGVLFGRIFKMPNERAPHSTWLASAELPHHSVYRDLPWKEIRPFVTKWFQPTVEVLRRVSEILEEFDLQCGEILAVNLRGSKKYREVEPVPTRYWVDAASDLLTTSPKLTVVVFCDDQDLVDAFSAQASFPVIDFGQEIRTRNRDSINKAFRAHVATDELVTNFVARTWLISQSRLVLTHTGNTAFWTCAFRGCTCGVYQFTASGTLATPPKSCDNGAHAGGIFPRC
jgi:hypothetical protein